MKCQRIIICVSLVVINLIFAFSALAQDESNQPPQKPELVERFEKIIKNNEPKFTLDRSRFRERLGKAVSSSMRWTLHADKVSLNIAEFDSLDDAKKRYNFYVDTPTPIPVPKTKLTDLGDEAVISVNSQKGKFESATIIIRKGNIVLDLRSNNIPAAKRFARHLVREVEKRDRGEP